MDIDNNDASEEVESPMDTGLKAQRYVKGGRGGGSGDRRRSGGRGGRGGGGKLSRSPRGKSANSSSPYDRKGAKSSSRTSLAAAAVLPIGTKVYVGNLSWDASWQDLKDFFSDRKYDVKFVSVLKDGTGRSKGCGLVELATSEQAREAIENLTDVEFMGRPIFVREDRENNGGSEGRKENNRNDGDRRDRSTNVPSCSVYVGNLSFDTAWQELKDHMRAGGNVDHAKIFENPEGQSKGSAIVQYQHPREARRAIQELHNSTLDGRNIIVREDKDFPIQKQEGSAMNFSTSTSLNNKIFVGNLSWDANWKDLKDLFKPCGHVERAEVIESNGRSKGFGNVEFFSSKDATRAVKKFHGSEFMGRKLEVRLDSRN